MGIVRELTERKRYRIIAYDAYLSILAEGTAPLARQAGFDTNPILETNCCFVHGSVSQGFNAGGPGQYLSEL